MRKVRTPMPAQRRAKTTNQTLTRREFFHDVAEGVRNQLPGHLQHFHLTTSHHLLKIHYGHPRLHYEVWTNARDGHIEIGLHFEDGPESTEWLIAFFDRHIVEIKHELGPDVELERWTNSWGHLYRTIPYAPLTEPLARDVTAHLSQMITLLQPLLIEADRRAAG